MCVCVYVCVVCVCVCVCVCTCVYVWCVYLCVYSVEKQSALISTTRVKVQEMFSGFLKHIWIVRLFVIMT